jgi:hypothetical protein
MWIQKKKLEEMLPSAAYAGEESGQGFAFQRWP